MAPFTDASRRRGLSDSELASDSNSLVFSRSEENFGLDKSVGFHPVSSNPGQFIQIDFTNDGDQPSGSSSSSSSAVNSVPSSASQQATSTTIVPSAVITSIFTTVVPVTSVDASSHTTVRSSTVVTTQYATITGGPQSLVAGNQNSGNDNKKSNTGAIAAGGVIAALVIIGIIVSLIFCHLRKKRRQREMEATRVEPFPQMDGPRDIEHAPITHNIPRIPPPMMIQSPLSMGHPPVSAHTAQLVVPSIASARPPSLKQRTDPFSDNFRIIDAEFENLDLSPGPHSATDAQHLTITRPMEQMQVKTASSAAFNPFANPTSPFVNEPRSSPAVHAGLPRGPDEHVRKASIKSVSTVSIEEPRHLPVAQQSARISYAP